VSPTARPGTTKGTRRAHDADATRRALLTAAQRLFGQRGYERTTTREIGEAAGADPALIARYFGSKADLYLAAVAADRLADSDGPVDPDSVESPFADLAEVAEVVLRRTAAHGPGPVLQALARDDASPEIRAAASARLIRRMVEPIAADYDAAGVDRPVLRAQTAVAAVIGVALGRSLGWFDELHGADPDELAGLLVEALGPQGWAAPSDSAPPPPGRR
jgi:AcrR family transcriptional regulator